MILEGFVPHPATAETTTNFTWRQILTDIAKTTPLITALLVELEIDLNSQLHPTNLQQVANKIGLMSDEDLTPYASAQNVAVNQLRTMAQSLVSTYASSPEGSAAA